ncbi:MAG: hypothetical protein AB1679_13165, partial [Actinomycetota bacterium]
GNRRPDQIGATGGGAGGPNSGSTGRPHAGQNRAATGNSPRHHEHNAIPAIVAAPPPAPNPSAAPVSGREDAGEAGAVGGLA